MVFIDRFVYTAWMKPFDVLIIGAGAAGLMCAIQAGQRGQRVLLLDHANKPGKKILMSGGGRCNFTNRHVSKQHFISHNPMFCQSALSRYQPQDFIRLVELHGIPYHEKTLGQLFCDRSSKDILNMLLTECRQASVEIRLKTTIKDIQSMEQAGYRVMTEDAQFDVASLVIATGGLSIPTMGSSPLGYQIAEQFGIKVWPTRAGLVPFTLTPADREAYATLSGISVDCRVHSHRQSFHEQMLFTHRGLSGPAMLQISSYWQSGKMIDICLQPDIDLLSELKIAQKNQPNLTLKVFFKPFFPKRVVLLFIGEALLSRKLKTFRYSALQDITDRMQHWSLRPNGTEGYRTAEVTLGGVDCDAISSKTFEANSHPGLYFIGEVLDVTGWLGGYNFQWAWASGHAAGACV